MIMATDSDDDEIPTLGDSFWNNATMGSPANKYFKCGKCQQNYGTVRNAHCFWCRYQKGRLAELKLHKSVKEFEAWASIAHPNSLVAGFKSIKRDLEAIGADAVALKRVNSPLGPFFFVVIDNADRPTL